MLSHKYYLKERLARAMHVRLMSTTIIITARSGKGVMKTGIRSSETNTVSVILGVVWRCTVQSSATVCIPNGFWVKKKN